MCSQIITNNVEWKAICQQVAESMSCRRKKTTGIGTILVPTDFSEYSDTALGLAIDLASQQGAKIYLLHIKRYRDQVNGFETMQRQIARFPESGDVEIIPDIREGKVYKEILNAEAEMNPDVIIMSRHTQNDSLMSLFRGITAKIRKKAHCSVLVVGA